jgi:predicted transcriptional regulator
VTRKDIVDKQQTRGKLAEMGANLSSSQEETRRNLRAIEKNKTADALRQKLTARLADAAAKLDDYSRKIVELDSKLSELTVQFKEAIRDVKVLPSPAG